MPSDKRARQRAGRQARMAELRRAQQRRRNTRRGAVVGGLVVLALILAAATSGVFSGGGSSSSKKVTTAGPTTATLTAAAQAALKATAPPAVGNCNVAPSTDAPTTTVPAKGNAVATIAAPSTVPFPALDGSAPHYTKFSAAPPFCLDLTKQYTATMKTDVGTIVITLLPNSAPVTVNNFVFLAGYHYFDGTVFHRVIPGFVDQGGDPTGTGTGGPGYTFADELPSSKDAYDTGAVAMANSGANTNGSQFFLITAGGGQQLTPAYSMFGQITSGIDVMSHINSDGTTAGTPKITHHIVSVSIQMTTPSAATTTTAPAAPATTAPATTTPPATTPPATTPAAPDTTTAPAPATAPPAG